MSIKILYKAFLFSIFVLINIHAQTDKINLVNNHKSKYKIVISGLASRWDSLAASELKNYLQKISGVAIPISDDSSPSQSKEIIIGRNNRTKDIDTSSIKADGFIIKTVDDKIYFMGGGRKGTLNSVYSFLEKYLGCKMYSAEIQIIPKQRSIILPQIDVVENPAFEYRDISYYENTKDEYCHWHKLVDSEDKNIWGMFVHTFQSLLPESQYFEEHPEYFALRGDIRVPEELCLSNPDVFKIVVDELKKRMAEHPEAKIWSVSQNDNETFCQCPECRKIDEQEDSPSGSIIIFVNKIAREFPDKIISTLAYRYSRKAPKYIKPEKNVNIMLCSIECYRTKPLDADTTSAGFVNDLIDWSKLTNNIFLWDYVVQFSNLVSPFPNFQVLQPNIQLFAKHKIKMMFQQGAGERNATEFGELRTYLIAKLLWNPNINVDSVMNDFLSGYYGAAGKYLNEYIGLMQNELIKSNHQLWIYSNPIDQQKDFLTPELMKKYNSLFDKAEQSVIKRKDFLQRVKIARLPIMYAMLEQAKISSGLVIKKGENKFETNPQIISLLNNFSSVTKYLDYVFLNEKGLTPEKYISRYKTMLSKTMQNPLGLNMPVQFLTLPNWKYPANGEKSLTDGICGDEDHLFNWVGFEGNDMEVVVDLQKNKFVKKVSADFIQNVFSWIFLPEQFEVSISNDGKVFKTVSTIKNTVPVTKEELASPIFAFIKNFSCGFEPVQTRYIKVKAMNMSICPRWHPGYPLKAWIFTDEIVIE
jgi:hypothetical protein